MPYSPTRSIGNARVDRRWYTNDAEDGALTRYMRWLRSRHDTRVQAGKRFAARYRDDRPGLMRTSGGGVFQTQNSAVTMNVSRAAVNTVFSKITMHRTKTTFSVEGGSVNDRELARDLNKFSLGLKEATGANKKRATRFLDSEVFGTGFTKFADFDDKITSDRLLYQEVLVDPAEMMYGEPRSVLQVRAYDKEVLKELFPDHAEAIENVEVPREDYDWMFGGELDDSDLNGLVLVTEGWRTCASDASKGVHKMEIGDLCLTGRKWTLPTPPIVSTRWSQEVDSWYGRGLIAELWGIQTEMNRLLQAIQMGMKMYAHPYVFAERGAQLKEGSFSSPGTYILYSGREPRVVTPTTASAEMFSHFDRLYQRSSDISGVSQLSMSGKLPQGLEGSGRAQLVHQDIQSERFAATQREWDDSDVAETKLMVGMAAMIGKMDVMVEGKEFLSRMNWKDISKRLKDRAFSVQAFPTALIEGTPEGKLAKIEKLMQAGLITDPVDAMALLDVPDLSGFVNRKTAKRRWADRVIEMALSGKKVTVDSNMDLAYFVDAGTEAWNLGLMEETHDYEDLEVLRRALARAVRISSMGTVPGAPPTLPGGAGAGMAGMPGLQAQGTPPGGIPTQSAPGMPVLQ